MAFCKNFVFKTKDGKECELKNPTKKRTVTVDFTIINLARIYT